VLGWLILRGKCAGCGSRISWKYPAVELLFAVVFAVYVWIEGVWPAGMLSFVMMAAGFSLVMIRAETGRFVLTLVWIYLVAFVVQVAFTALGFSSYVP
jgi:leader peptidase (prepilin peptidase)/N-methyltransferase